MKASRRKIEENDKKTININIVMSILMVGILSFVSVGYALYGQILNTRGTISFGTQGKIAITNVTLVSSKNVKDGSIPSFTDDSVDFNLVFEKGEGSLENSYQAVYDISIKNDTFYDYEFNLANFQPVIKNSSGINVDSSYLSTSLDGIALGDVIKAGETVNFTLTLDFNPEDDDTYTVDGNMNTDLSEEPHGSIIGSIPEGASGDLRESLGNDLAEFTITVINSYQSARTFTLNVADASHFQLVNSSGAALGAFTIEGGTTNTYTFYVKRAAGAVYLTESLTTGISLSYNEASNVACGSITLLVDEQEAEDQTPPIISNVTATINNATSDDTSNNNVGSVTVTWNGEDAESGVKKYYVIAQSNSETKTYETTDNNTTLTINGLADGSYTFKVYGENNHGYKASDSDISGANTGSGYCSKSSSYTFDWHYDVSLSNRSQNIRALSNTKVNRGYDYTTTLSPSNSNYSLSSTITVTMGGSSITSGTTAGHYRFTSSSGALTVYGVTGDVVITASASGGTSPCGG